MNVAPKDVERRLVALAADVRFPPTPDLAGAVGARLRGEDVPSSAPTRRLFPTLAAAAVLALALVLLASPAAREAVADWLGIGGVRITTEDPGEDSNDLGTDLSLGEPTSLDEAAAVVDFDLAFPAALDDPGEIYLATAEGFEQVAAVYRPSQVPGIEQGERLLFLQFRGYPEVPYFKKLLDADAGVDPLSVNGSPAFWLKGPHEIIYRGPDGTLRTDASRLALNTLLWELDGVTYRLESNLSKESSLRVARSVARGG